MKLGKKNYPLKIIDDWKRFEKYNKKKKQKTFSLYFQS